MAKKHLIIAAILAVLLSVYCLPDSYLLGERVYDMDIVENERTGTKTETGETILGGGYVHQPVLVCTYWRFDDWQKRKEYYQYSGVWIDRGNEPVHHLASGRPFRDSCPTVLGG